MKCPACKTPMTDYLTMGWSQCAECGLVKDHKQPPAELTIPPIDMMILNPAVWEVALAADESNRKPRP